MYLKKNLDSFIKSKDNHSIQYLKNILVFHLAKKKKKNHYLSTMGRGKHGTDVFREQVLAFRDLGLNNSEIARRLGCSRMKVFNTINLFIDTRSLSNKKRKSRKRKTTPREDAAITRIAKLNPFVGARKIKE